MNKTAFVIMPILHGEDYSLYRGIYDFYIKPPLERAGYEVERADDVQKSGAITKDIVYKLAESDIVVADLTDLNPNVFYELGIRHVLRKNGTVMLVDEAKTPKIPFDLSAYRVIMYQGHISKLGKLVDSMAEFLEVFRTATDLTADNPVHDWLPQLPSNAMAAASGSAEGKLRTTIAGLEATIKRYEKVHGSIAPVDARSTRSPKEFITSLYEDAEAGNLPSDVIIRAEHAVSVSDKRAFIGCLKQITDKNLRPTQREFTRLFFCSDELELGDDVSLAILEIAVEMYADDLDLQQLRLSKLVRSNNRKDRETARAAIRSQFGIVLTDDGVKLSEIIPKSKLGLLGVMLDSYQQDSLLDEAFAITAAFVERLRAKRLLCLGIEKV